VIAPSAGRHNWLKTALAGLVIGVVAMAVLPFAIGGAMLVPCLWQPTTFDVAAWRFDSGDSMCSARAGMVDDLKANHLKVGMARDEVLRLLGPVSDYRYDESIQSARALDYEVGCFIDCNWLVIDFDESDGLTSTSVWQD
jgi:hypothetical protein